jgi:hypothetical protein
MQSYPIELEKYIIMAIHTPQAEIIDSRALYRLNFCHLDLLFLSSPPPRALYRYTTDRQLNQNEKEEETTTTK